MHTSFNLKPALWLIALFLGIMALRPLYSPEVRVAADASKFDHIYIVATVFVYRGQQGLLLLDKRNGNIWFIGRGSDQMILKYGEPVFVTQIPLDKLDQAPR
jgi:hypothetical protein